MVGILAYLLMNVWSSVTKPPFFCTKWRPKPKALAVFQTFSLTLGATS